jgi:aminoglycoside phosphotransferase (APT) family kinase protein
MIAEGSVDLSDALRAYVAIRTDRQAGDIAVTDLRRAPKGGSRECYSFTMGWREGDSIRTGRYVLRRDPPASLLESDRETEFRVLKALEGSGVPVPRVYWLEREANAYLDRPFMIMEQIEGEMTPFFQLIAPDDPALREKRADNTVSALAELHAVDWESRGLGFLGVSDGPRGHAAMQVDHWEAEFKRVRLDAQPILTEAFLWLRAHMPTAPTMCLLHGDFKTDNVMYRGAEVRGILDWEMAAIGDPTADLAWFCLDRWSVDGLCCGLVKKDDFLSSWSLATGLAVDEEAFFFWTVLSNVKLAVIHLTGGYSFCTGATRDLLMAFTPYENIRLFRDLTALLEF